MPHALVTLQHHAKARGYFSPERSTGRVEETAVHELTMNPDSFTGRTDEETLSTLAHEMAHVWQQTHGTGPRRSHHDRERAAKMTRRSSNHGPGGADHDSGKRFERGRCYTERTVESTVAAKIEELEKLYRMPEGERIRLYLAARPKLVDILLEARSHIELQFDRGAVVELRFPRDYDGDHEGELLAMIQSHLDSDAALDRVDRFWDEWWGDASGRRESWPLYFGVEYAGELVR